MSKIPDQMHFKNFSFGVNVFEMQKMFNILLYKQNLIEAQQLLQSLKNGFER